MQASLALLEVFLQMMIIFLSWGKELLMVLLRMNSGIFLDYTIHSKACLEKNSLMEAIVVSQEIYCVIQRQTTDYNIGM